MHTHKTMTKEEFKARWDSNERGGGITYDDIADCAEAWGLCARPRTGFALADAKLLVLKAAGVES